MNYLHQYLNAVRNPLPELKETFDAETKYLSDRLFPRPHSGRCRPLDLDLRVLDVGCGTGRTIKNLINSIGPYFIYVGIDSSPDMVAQGIQHLTNPVHTAINLHTPLLFYPVMVLADSLTTSGLPSPDIKKNLATDYALVMFSHADALAVPIEDNSMDFVYSSYCVINDIPKESHLRFIEEQKRVARPGAVVSTMTWLNTESVRKFLEPHYTAMGFKTVKITEDTAYADDFVSPRFSSDYIINLYEQAGLKKIDFKRIGPLWFAVEGVKE